jgi:hypothetical protein
LGRDTYAYRRYRHEDGWRNFAGGETFPKLGVGAGHARRHGRGYAKPANTTPKKGMPIVDGLKQGFSPAIPALSIEFSLWSLLSDTSLLAMTSY